MSRIATKRYSSFFKKIALFVQKVKNFCPFEFVHKFERNIAAGCFYIKMQNCQPKKSGLPVFFQKVRSFTQRVGRAKSIPDLTGKNFLFCQTSPIFEVNASSLGPKFPIFPLVVFSGKIFRILWTKGGFYGKMKLK